MTKQNDSDSDERLLSILHAHGQQFLSAFNFQVAPTCPTKDPGGSESEEEWTGIDSSSNRGISDSEAASEDGQDNDDGITASSSRTPDVMVFSESKLKPPEANSLTKKLRKSFMSSKVPNITLSSVQSASKEQISDGESDEECTNTQNDALLHRLVHTKLLSGSLNPELNLNHAQRGRALAGRVLELSGDAKFGRGESVFRQGQRNKAAKRIRDGLMRKQREDEKKALEEAKNLGNYHPTLKRLYDSNTSSTTKKKRVRGLGMGVGKFAGGTLKLNQREIASVTGSVKRLPGGGRRGIRSRPL